MISSSQNNKKSKRSQNKNVKYKPYKGELNSLTYNSHSNNILKIGEPQNLKINGQVKKRKSRSGNKKNRTRTQNFKTLSVKDEQLKTLEDECTKNNNYSTKEICNNIEPSLNSYQSHTLIENQFFEDLQKEPEKLEQDNDSFFSSHVFQTTNGETGPVLNYEPDQSPLVGAISPPISDSLLQIQTHEDWQAAFGFSNSCNSQNNYQPDNTVPARTRLTPLGFSSVLNQVNSNDISSKSDTLPKVQTPEDWQAAFGFSNLDNSQNDNRSSDLNKTTLNLPSANDVSNTILDRTAISKCTVQQSNLDLLLSKFQNSGYRNNSKSMDTLHIDNTVPARKLLTPPGFSSVLNRVNSNDIGIHRNLEPIVLNSEPDWSPPISTILSPTSDPLPQVQTPEDWQAAFGFSNLNSSQNDNQSSDLNKTTLNLSSANDVSNSILIRPATSECMVQQNNLDFLQSKFQNSGIRYRNNSKSMDTLHINNTVSARTPLAPPGFSSVLNQVNSNDISRKSDPLLQVQTPEDWQAAFGFLNLNNSQNDNRSSDLNKTTLNSLSANDVSNINDVSSSILIRPATSECTLQQSNLDLLLSKFQNSGYRNNSKLMDTLHINNTVPARTSLSPPGFSSVLNQVNSNDISPTSDPLPQVQTPEDWQAAFGFLNLNNSQNDNQSSDLNKTTLNLSSANDVSYSILIGPATSECTVQQSNLDLLQSKFQNSGYRNNSKSMDTLHINNTVSARTPLAPLGFSSVLNQVNSNDISRKSDPLLQVQTPEDWQAAFGFLNLNNSQNDNRSSDLNKTTLNSLSANDVSNINDVSSSILIRPATSECTVQQSNLDLLQSKFQNSGYRNNSKLLDTLHIDNTVPARKLLTPPGFSSVLNRVNSNDIGIHRNLEPIVLNSEPDWSPSISTILSPTSDPLPQVQTPEDWQAAFGFLNLNNSQNDNRSSDLNKTTLNLSSANDVSNKILDRPATSECTVQQSNLDLLQSKFQNFGYRNNSKSMDTLHINNTVPARTSLTPPGFSSVLNRGNSNDIGSHRNLEPTVFNNEPDWSPPSIGKTLSPTSDPLPQVQTPEDWQAAIDFLNMNNSHNDNQCPDLNKTTGRTLVLRPSSNVFEAFSVTRTNSEHTQQQKVTYQPRLQNSGYSNDSKLMDIFRNNNTVPARTSSVPPGFSPIINRDDSRGISGIPFSQVPRNNSHALPRETFQTSSQNLDWTAMDPAIIRALTTFSN